MNIIVDNESDKKGLSCPECGMENVEGARFCAECGQDMQAQSDTADFSCPECGAANPENSKFCAECGQEIPSSSNEPDFSCPECGAANPENSKFCAECGKLIPVSESQLSSSNICSKCGYKNPDNSQFCADCGNDLPLINASTDTICPKCAANNPPGSTFCADCGKTLFEKKVTTQRKRRNRPSPEESKSSGGLGGIFGKKSGLKEGLSGALSGLGEKTQSQFEKKESPRSFLKNKKEEGNGYLVCDSCGGYYELGAGESADDFEECHCGGNLNFSRNLN